ncbi:MAG TPA: threonine--tRNA ligase [Polyangiaceae bacterium]|nr:threonine--tRNA ligase [Polyangiaceae bacterium]
MSAVGSERVAPGQLLEKHGERLADVVAVTVDGKLGDLHTPVAAGADVKPIRVGEPHALEVIRHSAAHVMADAVQRLFPGTQVTIGPAIDAGFYYDFFRAEGPFTDKDLASIEKEMRRLIKEKRPFIREEVSREQAQALFEKMGEKFKLEIIDAIPAGDTISLYRHGWQDKPQGAWVDVCRGPHVQHTGQIGAVKLMSVAGAYWRGDEHNPMLTRIYGTAFPTEEELQEHLKLLEEAKARDHRKLGKELELFMFHEYAPAMPFFLPRGAGIYNRLVDYIRSLYVDYGYEEVITPQFFDKKLYETSGHLANYMENMYLPVPSEQLKSEHDHEPRKDLDWVAAKPMNCPGHCLMFGQRRRSYRELPWRVADFGRLHRYERAGVVHGLARVRTFCQDDAHIFCTPDQLEAEILSFNKLLFEVYSAFQFTNVSVKLALRPESRLGSDELWDKAEGALERALLQSGVPFEKLPGEGAFYGPKLEFHVVDALKRGWQLGTIQLDYSMPERFGLEFVGSDGNGARPVMLHRAILGSVERFFGIYTEHCAGKFPVWLAPEQVVLVTVSEKQADYAYQVQSQLKSRGLRVSVDAGPDKLGAKIRNARNMRTPYIGVIGENEVTAGTLALRSREEGDLPPMSVAEATERLVKEALPPRVTQKQN